MEQQSQVGNSTAVATATGATLSFSTTALSSSSSIPAEDYSVYHHYPSLPFSVSGGGPGAGTSAAHARMASTPQQHDSEGASSTTPRSPSQVGSHPLLQPQQQQGYSALGASASITSHDDPLTAVTTAGAAPMPTAMFRRPFLEEDELPEYMSLPEFGLPFKIPAAQSITYTVIPSQGPEEFQQHQQQQQDDLPNSRGHSIEEGPLDLAGVRQQGSPPQQQHLQSPPSIVVPSSASSVHGEVRLDIDRLISPAPQHQQRRQRSQGSRGPWTLEYWVDDTIMHLLYLMDPKHSATTSLVPRTIAQDRVIAVPAATATIGPSLGVLSYMRNSEGIPMGAQIEVQAIPEPPARTSTSTSGSRSRSQNRNSTTTPGTSILSGLGSAPQRQQSHARRLSSQSNALSLSVPGPTTPSPESPTQQQPRTSRQEYHDSGQAAMIVAMMSGIDPNQTSGGRGENDSDNTEEVGEESMERVPVGHIRGRPPPLSRRRVGVWPTIPQSTLEQLSAGRLFNRRGTGAGPLANQIVASTPTGAATAEPTATTIITEESLGVTSSVLEPTTAEPVNNSNDDTNVTTPEHGQRTEEAIIEENTIINDSSTTALEPPSAAQQPQLLSSPSLIPPPPGTMVRVLPSIQHIQINDGYAGEEEDTALAHALQATVSQGGNGGGNNSTIHRNNAFNNALTSEFFKHPSFAFVSADDPQTWIWWSTHHETSLQRCRQEGPNEEIMMWWRTRLDYTSKENKEKRRLEKLRRKQLGLDKKKKEEDKNLSLVERWKRLLSLEASTPHRQSMEITMRVRGLYYAWREEEVENDHDQQPILSAGSRLPPSSSLSTPPPPPPISPAPGSMHMDGMDFDEDQGSQFGMTSIRPRSTSTTPLPPPPSLTPPPPPLLPTTFKKSSSRFFQLVRDDAQVMGQRVKGGTVAEVWITEESDEEDEDIGRIGHGLHPSSSSQQHGYASTPTYQSVLENSPTSSPAPAPYYPLVRSDRSSSVTSNNGNTFMTDVSAATGGPVRSSMMTGPLIRPSGRSYASSSRYPLSDLDTPAPSFQDAMTTGTGGGGGAASSGYYGPGGGGGHGHGHAQSHRRQRSSVAFSSSRSSSIAPTDDGHYSHHHPLHHHRHYGQGRPGPQVSSTLGVEDVSSFPKSLRRRKCTIRVMTTLNEETSTFALSTGPRLIELFDLFTDQSVPGPSRGAFICSVVVFSVVFLIVFISLAFAHRS
ncbi:hypothetical protein BGZ83_008053 [Gryganskiella cystojenkinii]|nr:hypothetical protein BGZ83_008053 [Gryganskiella cystojenkinii]